jgi:meiotic recombination protein SPO11
LRAQLRPRASPSAAPVFFCDTLPQVRSFDDQSQVKKVAIMARIAQCIHELCVKVCILPSGSSPKPRMFTSFSFQGIHVTKRDLFYTDVKLFEKQTASDAVLEEMGCALFMNAIRIS